MAQTNDRLERLVLEARRSAETREQGYRAQALKLFPWVCGRCARTFDHANLQLLEVHHRTITTMTTRLMATIGNCFAPTVTKMNIQRSKTWRGAAVAAMSCRAQPSIRSLI